MENEKFKVSDVYYRIYYNDGNNIFYTEPDHDYETAKTRFKRIMSKSGKDKVKMVRVMETEETLEG